MLDLRIIKSNQIQRGDVVFKGAKTQIRLIEALHVTRRALYFYEISQNLLYRANPFVQRKLR